MMDGVTRADSGLLVRSYRDRNPRLTGLSLILLRRSCWSVARTVHLQLRNLLEKGWGPASGH